MIQKSLMQQESPMKQEYDNFDIQHIRWSESDYKEYAMTVPVPQTTSLLLKDWERRAISKMNCILSANGQSGSGKSSFLSACCLKLGEIYTRVLKLKYPAFSVNNVYYEPEDMQERVRNDLKLGEILLKDEHLKGKAGMGSDLTSNFLTDAEQQLRKNQNSFAFASIEDEDHANFFEFEMKHVLPNPQTGFPAYVVAMLKTPRYSNPEEFVWRGLVAFSFPPMDYWRAYELRKDQHILKLKSQYGNNLAPAEIDAIKIFKGRHDELVTRTREGLMKPIKNSLIESIISDEIGTRKYTNKMYGILKDQIINHINMEYLKVNEMRMQEISERRDKERQERKELILFQMQQAKELKEEKLKAFQEKLAQDKERVELKKKALEIRELELKKAQESKDAKEKAFAEKVVDKKKELDSKEGNAKHFVEEFTEDGALD